MNKEIIDKTIAALRHNHFEAFFAHNTAEASAIFFRDIFPGLQVETVSGRFRNDEGYGRFE